MSAPRIPHTHVLLVEDNPAYARLTALILEECFAGNVRVTHATTLGRALQQLAEDPADVVVVDLGLPDAQGTEVVVRLREAQAPPVVVLSGLDTEGLPDRLREAGVAAHVSKGRELDELPAAIRAALADG